MNREIHVRFCEKLRRQFLGLLDPRTGMIDEGNNVRAVYDFIRLFNWYGQKNVRIATETVSQLGADNPLRNISYVAGVLKKMKKEGAGMEKEPTVNLRN